METYDEGAPTAAESRQKASGINREVNMDHVGIAQQRSKGSFAKTSRSQREPPSSVVTAS
ncbi:hypothetical protein LN037_11790 [Actinomycetospora sp. SF1]|nr:hypothetical protein [Actinomycetospora soli]